MIFLLLSILSSTMIFVCFKLADKYGLPSMQIIVINYLVAALTGIIAAAPLHITELTGGTIVTALLIGVMFIIMFYVISLSTHVAGISITTVASKMSVIFPIIFSLLIEQNDRLTSYKAAGIGLSFIAVLLTIWNTRTSEVSGLSRMGLPILLFVGMGIVDSVVKYAQFNFVTDKVSLGFTGILFATSAIIGLIVLMVKKNGFKDIINYRTIATGIILGIANFGSIYFLIRALNIRNISDHFFESSEIFAVNNTGIVSVSVITGLLLFKERLTPVNWSGILLAILAIYLLTL